MLVCFHDDMLDQHLEAYGDVADWPWEDLQRFRFRNPGRFGDQCRIPTLVEVFDLHRRHAGLMHLDIKRPGLDKAIAELLTKMDMWDHVGYCNTDHGGVILKDERYKPRRYKGGLYLDRGEVFPDAIAAVLKKPGDGVIVDDPRGVAVALGRKLGKLSTEPVSRKPPPEPIMREAEANPFAILKTTEATSDRILHRARAADQLLELRVMSKEAFARPGGASPQPDPAQGVDVPRPRRGDGPAGAHPAQGPQRRRAGPVHACGATTRSWRRSPIRSTRTRARGPTSA